MKKVIRLTESDLMRIVKRVINEQQQTGQTESSGVTPEVGQYLDKPDKKINANMVLVPFDVNKDTTNLESTETYRNENMKKLLDGYKQAKDAGVKQKYLTSIMTQMNSGNIRLQPSNGGIDIKPYGAKYIPADNFNFKVVSCTQQKPCRVTDSL
jgi:hypothetical protein